MSFAMWGSSAARPAGRGSAGGRHDRSRRGRGAARRRSDDYDDDQGKITLDALEHARWCRSKRRRRRTRWTTSGETSDGNVTAATAASGRRVAGRPPACGRAMRGDGGRTRDGGANNADRKHFYPHIEWFDSRVGFRLDPQRAWSVPGFSSNPRSATSSRRGEQGVAGPSLYAVTTPIDGSIGRRAFCLLA
jgi:hypothetical protein